MSDEGALPEPSLELLVTQLAAQALMQLGQAPNPLSGVAEVALALAAGGGPSLRGGPGRSPAGAGVGGGRGGWRGGWRRSWGWGEGWG